LGGGRGTQARERKEREAEGRMEREREVHTGTSFSHFESLLHSSISRLAIKANIENKTITFALIARVKTSTQPIF